MHHALIVARIAPDAADRVAEIFAESDRTELPWVVGVRHRSLYQLGDLYAHLVVTGEPPEVAVARGADHPEFARVSQRLRPYISPYLPTWRSPRDAMAHCFYRWDAPERSGAPQPVGPEQRGGADLPDASAATAGPHRATTDPNRPS